MDGTSHESDKVRPLKPSSPADRRAALKRVIDALEESLGTLEALELTLAVALLDHAIAETKRELTR
jgi:hypothetical protein